MLRMPFNFSAFRSNLMLIAPMFYFFIHDQIPSFSSKAATQQGRLKLAR
jgi:hypothetical protein